MLILVYVLHFFSSDNVLQKTPPKPMSVRRSSKSKPVPPALVIHPSSLHGSAKKNDKDPMKKYLGNRLQEFAEFATSPRSPLIQSPLPFSLTPGLLGSENTPDWLTKSPFGSKFSFPDKPVSNCMQH